MALTYLIDEHLRGTLFTVLVRVARHQGFELDVVQVGDGFAPPLGTEDPDLIAWAEAEGRVMISLDRNSLPIHLAAHLASGRQSPGILVLLDEPLMMLAEYLVLAAYASDPAEWWNQINFFP